MSEGCTDNLDDTYILICNTEQSFLYKLSYQYDPILKTWEGEIQVDVKITINFIFLLLLLQYSCKPHNINAIYFEKLYVFDRDEKSITEQGIYYRSRIDNFMVVDYYEGKDVEQKMDSFVCANLPDSIYLYTNYSIKFYIKTKTTNNEYFFIWKKDMDLNAVDDHLLSYVWINGEFLIKYKFFEGHIIDSNSDFQCAGNRKYPKVPYIK